MEMCTIVMHLLQVLINVLIYLEVELKHAMHVVLTHVLCSGANCTNPNHYNIILVLVETHIQARDSTNLFPRSSGLSITDIVQDSTSSKDIVDQAPPPY